MADAIAAFVQITVTVRLFVVPGERINLLGDRTVNQIFMVIFSCCQDLSSEMSGATEDGKKMGGTWCCRIITRGKCSICCRIIEQGRTIARDEAVKDAQRNLLKFLPGLLICLIVLTSCCRSKKICHTPWRSEAYRRSCAAVRGKTTKTAEGMLTNMLEILQQKLSFMLKLLTNATSQSDLSTDLWIFKR